MAECAQICEQQEKAWLHKIIINMCVCCCTVVMNNWSEVFFACHAS
jgi:hypothetical protein